MSSKSSKMPLLGDTEGIKRWHNERGIPWGPVYDGPLPLVVRRMVPAGTWQLSNLSVHLSNEHGINSDKAPRGPEVEHMHAHTFGLYRFGQEHYHGEVPEPEQAKPEPEGRRSWAEVTPSWWAKFHGAAYSPKLDGIVQAIGKAVAVVPGCTPELHLDILARELEARGWSYAAEPEQAKPEQRRLEWHEGEHGWDTHDGYPRHQHSLNGNLTISPKSTRLHFKGSTFEDEAQL